MYCYSPLGVVPVFRPLKLYALIFIHLNVRDFNLTIIIIDMFIGSVRKENTLSHLLIAVKIMIFINRH